VGILRLSGPRALAVAAPFAPGVPENPLPRHAYFTDFTDASGAILDQGLFLYFRAPNSYTGEDVVEFQVHGSPRLLQLLQAQVLRIPSVRLAEAGEFTRRAFLNGRIDLVRAEAIADLVAADSEAAVRAAARQTQGRLSERVRALRNPLLTLQSELEGLLNFPAEAEEVDTDFPARLESIGFEAKELLAQAKRGRLLRRGARVVLFGPVNAGKSTLFNQLLREPRALVDDEPGTTRDLLEARLEIAGLGITLVDTAGLREDPGRLEALGMQRAVEAVRAADLAVLVLPPDPSANETQDWMKASAEIQLLRVRSKSDLAACDACGDLRVSGLTGAGVDLLEREIVSRLWGSGAPQASELTSERHQEALRRAVEGLERALEAASVSTLEVVSGEIGLAVEALGEITGENAPDELLDAIFQRFCIGK
jgi:tRNA modification GTPase